MRQLNFKKFIGLDFSTTKYDASSTYKDNMIGFQIAKTRIKNNILHLPYNFANITSNTGRFFSINNILYILQTDWLYKYENWNYSQVLSHTFSNNTEYYKIVKWQKIWTKLTTLTADKQEDSQYITITQDIDNNKYLWKIAVIWSEKYYITSNLKNQLFIEMMVEWAINNWDDIDIYDIENTLIIYDWQDLFSYDWTLNTISSNIPNSFIFNYHNKLVVVKPDQIITSTMSENTFFPKLNYINISKTYDALSFEDNIKIFTDQWIFCMAWLWEATLNFVKNSDFKTTERVYPIAYKWRIFLNIDWKIQIIQNNYPWQILNYKLSPNDINWLFKINEWLLSQLPHTTDRILLLDYEELENDNTLTATELTITGTLIDIINYQNNIFICTNNWIYKSNNYDNIEIKTNKIVFPKKIFIKNIILTQNATVKITINWNEYTLPLNNTNNQYIYPVNKRWSEIEIDINSNTPIQPFILYYK